MGSIIYDAIFQTSLLAMQKTQLDSRICNECFVYLKKSHQAYIDYLSTAISKFGSANIGLRDLAHCGQMKDGERAEYSFYSGILLLSASMDSLACLLNAEYELKYAETSVYFNDDLINKLPQQLKDELQPSLGLLDRQKFRGYRNAISHRSVFRTIALRSGPDDPTSENSPVEYFTVLRDPSMSIFDEKVLNNYLMYTTNAHSILSAFVTEVSDILRIAFSFISKPQKSLGDFKAI